MKRIIFFVALIFLLAPTTFADDASIGGYGATVELLNNEDIRMVSETIDLTENRKLNSVYDVYEYTTKVHVTYNFKNTSDRTVVARMGFPENIEYSYGDEFKLHDFKVLDGAGNERPVEFVDSLTAVTPGRNWYIHEEEFAPGEEKVVQNKYWINNSAYKTGSWFDYTLETGATWKDTIGELGIVVHLEDGITLEDVRSVSPAGFMFDLDKNEILWHFTYFEPTEDDNINVGFESDFVYFGCYGEFDGVELDEWDHEYLLEWGSSFLVEPGYAYAPCLAFDKVSATSWVEGVSGDGIGESITMWLNDEKTYSSVGVFNGFRESQELWEKNSRVKSLLISGRGVPDQKIELEDTYDLQIIQLETPLVGVSELSISIAEVYPGTTFEDTALSEIEFVGILTDARIVGQEDENAVFSDIFGNSYRTAIEYLKENGVVEGYSDGTYRPYSSINRAEFTKIIIESRFDGEEIDNCLAKSSGTGLFQDVQVEQWFAKYVCVAKDKGIVDGYPDGTFRPADRINFVEAAKILVNTFGYPVEEDEKTWYAPYVRKLGELSATPVSIGTFDQDVDRGEMAEMMYRLLEDIQTEPSKTYKTFLNSL